MEKKLRVGIIGCGGIANGKHMPALAKYEKQCEMVAFCDIIEERAVKAAKDYGSEDAKSYVDYKELLKDESIDVVHVCTPNRYHYFNTIDALEAGKHVMCEKPMAKSYAEGCAMLEAAKRTGKKLTIGYQNRQLPENLYSKQLCKAGDLGEIFARLLHFVPRGVPTWEFSSTNMEQGGNPHIDIGTHALDLTLYMMDNYKPKMVMGKTFRKLADQTNQGNGWGNWDPKEYTVEDSAFGFIIMENGALIELNSSWALNWLDTSEATFVLCGDQAGIDIKGDKVRINKFNKNHQSVEEVSMSRAGAAYFEVFHPAISIADIGQWLNAIINDTDPCVLPEQAITRILRQFRSTRPASPYILTNRFIFVKN